MLVNLNVPAKYIPNISKVVSHFSAKTYWIHTCTHKLNHTCIEGRIPQIWPGKLSYLIARGFIYITCIRDSPKMKLDLTVPYLMRMYVSNKTTFNHTALDIQVILDCDVKCMLTMFATAWKYKSTKPCLKLIPTRTSLTTHLFDF